MNTTTDTSSQLIFSGVEFKQTLHGRWADLIFRCVHQGCVCVYRGTRVSWSMLSLVLKLVLAVSTCGVRRATSGPHNLDRSDLRHLHQNLVNEGVKFYFIL
jgi:hypothetical protein